MQVFQPQGFAQLNGSGLGVVEGFMGVGEQTLESEDFFITPCPVGSTVDGYQVVIGSLILQIRPRCSCFNCGANPQPPLLEQLNMHACLLRAKLHAPTCQDGPAAMYLAKRFWHRQSAKFVS